TRVGHRTAVDVVLVPAANLGYQRRVRRPVDDLEDRGLAVLARRALAARAGPRDGYIRVGEADFGIGAVLLRLHLADARAVAGPAGDGARLRRVHAGGDARGRRRCEGAILRADVGRVVRHRIAARARGAAEQGELDGEVRRVARVAEIDVEPVVRLDR